MSGQHQDLRADARVAALLFNHGERYYGFKGLRAYKDKFNPHWEPRFIASPGGISLMQGLADLNALIADPHRPGMKPDPTGRISTDRRDVVLPAQLGGDAEAGALYA